VKSYVNSPLILEECQWLGLGQYNKLNLVLMNLKNSEMLKLSDWFKANKLSLNMQKSNYIIFKPRQKRDGFTINIEMNGLKMNQV